jgi:acetate---CoA ligase (ADP-forming)
MITHQLLEPDSIVIIGASNDIEKPGGKVLKNIINGGYGGILYAINPKEEIVQGIKCYKSTSELPDVDLAIVAIASKFIPESMEFLASQKNCRAFIVLSAGFSEIGEEGKLLEDEIVEIADKYSASLIGPNCIGVLTPRYKGSFAGPIPKFDYHGIDFVSGSGATAVFILETAIPMGLTFASLFSVGNSAQIGVEEVLKFWDENFDPEKSSKIKMIYIEQINKPDMFLNHCRSLIQKGCRIAAIKAGTTQAGSRAVSSHTGALAGSDDAVESLFRKAGVVRCSGREELAYIAGLLTYKPLTGDRIAVITHAGGPGVMLTDALSKGGLNVPHIEGDAAAELLGKLFHGSSVANPIDFLATGNAEQLGIILDYVDSDIDNIDASVVIFGTPGLFDVKNVYKVLDEKMKTCNKPIYPVLPSVIQAYDAIEYFKSLGHVFFQDEVLLGNALSKIYSTPKPSTNDFIYDLDKDIIREIINSSADGFLRPVEVQNLLTAAGIPCVKEKVVNSVQEAIEAASDIGFPLVMKVVGPVHKSDVGGVRLGVKTEQEVEHYFKEIMTIRDSTGVLIQKMLSKDSLELFLGAKRESGFNHLVLCGMGGIFVEIFKDVASSLIPLTKEEALAMIRSLKSYPLIKGIRGRKGTNEIIFADLLLRLASLCEIAPEIAELDINPLLASGDEIIAVDARIKIIK